MPESTSQLHRFHLSLCNHVAGNVAIYLDNLAIPDDDRQLYAGLIDCLHQALTPGEVLPSLVLNDGEFQRLKSWTANMPNHERSTWLTDGSYRRMKAVDCVKEIKDELAADWGSRWSADSMKFANQLEQENLPVTEGVDVVWRWSTEVCRYLHAMGKDEFLPRPDGDYPTPTTLALPRKPESKVARYLDRLTAASTEKAYKQVMDDALEVCQHEEVREIAQHEKIISSVESMQWAIKNGGDTTGYELIRRVNEHNRTHPDNKRASSRGRCFLALRILEHLGEHTPGEDKAKRKR